MIRCFIEGLCGPVAYRWEGQVCRVGRLPCEDMDVKLRAMRTKSKAQVEGMPGGDKGLLGRLRGRAS